MVPPVLARAAAALAEGAARLRGRTTSLCRARVGTILHGHRYDGSRATRELGLEYTPIADTIRRTVAWYARAGLLGAHGDGAVADYDEDPARAWPDPRHRARRTP